jgi:hypothetical protein
MVDCLIRHVEAGAIVAHDEGARASKPVTYERRSALSSTTSKRARSALGGGTLAAQPCRKQRNLPPTAWSRPHERWCRG